MIQFGEIIRARRKALGISQNALADMAHVHRVTVIDIEQGRVSSRYDVILDILHALGLDLEVVEWTQ